MKTETKSFAPDANSFVANGVKYLIHGSLPLGRYQVYEKLQAQIAWGVDFEKQHRDLKKAWDLLNQTKLGEAAVWINNMMEGIAHRVEKREHPALLLCTVFICREGEDMTAWDETEALEKIADWKAEGIDAESFFEFAFSLVKGWTAVYRSLSAATSREGERKM